MNRIKNLFLACGVFALVWSTTGRAQNSSDGIDDATSKIVADRVAATPAQQMAAQAKEQELLARAARLAIGGELRRAWKAIVADLGSNNGKNSDGILAERLGWRVLSVVGFLKNQEEGEIADAFARFALGEPWCQKSPSDVVRYWCAQIALEGAHDRRAALLWLGAANPGEGDAVQQLRKQLEAEEAAFPSNN